MKRSKSRYHRGWIQHRLDKLPESATTREVMDTTKISNAMLRRWLADPMFRKAGVAMRLKDGWQWNREKLKLWVASFPPGNPDWTAATGRAKASNPPGEGETPSRDEARALLGIPEGYRVKE